MHSIEIINAINSPEHEELTAAQVAEHKARHWIGLGAQRAIEKAEALVAEDLGLLDRIPFESLSAREVVEVVQENLRETARLLRHEQFKQSSIAGAWRRRAES